VLMFRSCLLNLLTRLISSRMKAFRVQIVMQQGYLSLQMDEITMNNLDRLDKDLDNRCHLMTKLVPRDSHRTGNIPVRQDLQPLVSSEDRPPSLSKPLEIIFWGNIVSRGS
jgi:hypothetical protein